MSLDTRRADGGQGDVRTAVVDTFRARGPGLMKAAGRFRGSGPHSFRPGRSWRPATAMAGAGIPEPLRNRAINHIDDAAGNAAIDGKQAQRIRDRWADRTDAIIAARTPSKPAYNSPEHKAEMAANLAAARLDEDQVAQHMAAASSRANPPSAAVKRAPGENKPRRTAPGSGVRSAGAGR